MKRKVESIKLTLAGLKAVLAVVLIEKCLLFCSVVLKNKTYIWLVTFSVWRRAEHGVKRREQKFFSLYC